MEQKKMAHFRTLLKNTHTLQHKPMTLAELKIQTDLISARHFFVQEAERKENKQKRIEALMRRTAIPSRYREARLIPVNNQDEAFEKGEWFVRDIKNRLKTGAGMLLWGDIGTGKTYLACAIANALISQMRPVLYCTALEAVQLVKATWTKKDDNQSEYEVYGRFGEPQLLIIDEIGVQSGTDFERVVLTSIADIRSRNCLPTIVISNLNPDDIYKLIGRRAFDRLVGHGADVVQMNGKSLR